jgi:hypothetical protein
MCEESGYQPITPQAKEKILTRRPRLQHSTLPPLARSWTTTTSPGQASSSPKSETGETMEISDREAIQELKARYLRLLDTKEWAEWRTLFTDDFTFFNEASPVPISTTPSVVGADNFLRHASSALQPLTTVHHGHMPEIHFIDERRAVGIWAMFDWVRDPEQDQPRVGYGHYHERYEKGNDGKWRIKELRLTRLLLEGPTPGSTLEARS